MTIINKKSSKIKNTKLEKKKEDKKYKKSSNINDDDDNINNDESDNLHSDSDIESKEFNNLEYTKMLAKMFPSKHMTEKVAKMEVMEKLLNECEKERIKNTNKDKKNFNKKNTELNDENKEISDDDMPLVELKNKSSTIKKIKKNSGIKKINNNSKNKKPLHTSSKNKNEDHNIVNESKNEKNDDDNDSKNSDTDTTINSESASSYDSDEAGFREFAKGKFNIVININDPSKDEDEYSKNSDSDSNEDDCSSNCDDSDSDPDYLPDEVEYEEEDDDYYEDEEDSYEESEDSYENKKICKKSKLNSCNSNKLLKNENKQITDICNESLETILKIKSQMEDLLKINKNDKIAKETLHNMIQKEKDYIKNKEKELRETKKKHVKSFKKLLRKRSSTNDLKYFKDHLSPEQQSSVLQELEALNKMTIIEKPYRLALLECDIPKKFKAIALKKITNLRYMEPGAGEYYKIKNWVDTFMQIPFNRINNLPLTIEDGVDKCHTFMEDAKHTLDSAVYGLNDAKMQIMQMVGQWISNPSAMGTAIAIKGPPGTGKTTLLKDGISKILNREFAFIPLGGATDSSFLEGHSYTYEGSTWGKIVDILIHARSMNPVIYFDELDKISDTPKGEEIAGILTHLTDTSQNSQFHDKYFAEIDFDLSKCLFIFSYNDESKVNPILLDRMYRIQTSGYSKKDKTFIAQHYLIPKIRLEVNFKNDDIIITDETIEYIIENYANEEDGVRNLKRCLEIIHTKLNLYRLMKPGTSLFDKENSLEVCFPFTLTYDSINKLIKKDEKNKAPNSMYI